MHRVSPGSLFKVGEVWYWSGYIDGKRVKKRIGHSKTVNKHEAEEAVRKMLGRIEGSIHGDLRKITFEELAEEWLENHKMDKRRHTIDSYSLQVLTHLNPSFGKLLVSAIRPEDIEKFKQTMSKKVSATTVNYDLRLLRSVLDTGCRWG